MNYWRFIAEEAAAILAETILVIGFCLFWFWLIRAMWRRAVKAWKERDDELER